MPNPIIAKSDSGRRAERVAARIQQELAAVLSRDFADPRLAGVVVCAVVVTDDLSLARVAFVVMGDADGAKARAAHGVLKRISGAVRAKLASRVELRRVPELCFDVDSGREESQRLDALLNEVSEELKKP